MSKYNIPQGSQQAAQGSLETGGGVKLPYPHAFFSWHNGNRQIPKELGEQHTGGFKADEAEFLALLAQVNGQLHVKHFNLHELTPQSGEAYKAFMRRAMAIAPIAARERWIVTKEGKNVFQYQVAGLMAVEKPLVYVAPVVLTAKGYFQGNNLKDAVRDNSNASAEARAKFAQGAAPNFFYQFIGTFGEPTFEMVGKTAKSPITPIKAFAGKVATEEALDELYIGDELAEQMGKYIELSQEWIADWKKKDDKPQDNFTPTEAQADEQEIPW